MKIKNLFLSLTVIVLLSGCAEMMQLSQQYMDSDAPLSKNEIIAGLKEALVTGTNHSAGILGATDGYYKDELVKILLPPEADMIVKNVSKIPGGEKLLEDVLLHINRAAEDAVSDAKPIFVNSITSMTIGDGIGILKGEDNAATQYLQRTTHDQLFSLYRPKIKASVEKELVGGISTKESWDTLIDKWNILSKSIVGQMAGFQPVDTELEDYLTEKAMEGLFLKIADEEKQIRKNPAARVSSLLKKVFGSLDS